MVGINDGEGVYCSCRRASVAIRSRRRLNSTCSELLIPSSNVSLARPSCSNVRVTVQLGRVCVAGSLVCTTAEGAAGGMGKANWAATSCEVNVISARLANRFFLDRRLMMYSLAGS